MALKNKGNILVGIDFTKSSENALNYAALLAERSNYDITLFHVFDTPVVHANSGAYFIEYASLKQNFTARLEQYKKNISEKYPLITIHVFTTFNSFKAEVEELVNKKKIQLLIVGLETKTKISKFIYGTTGVDIAGKINCPVIIVPEKYKHHNLSHIVLAIDNKHKQHAKEIKQVKKFAELFNCTINYLHVRTEDELVIEKSKNKDLPMETINSKDFKTGISNYLKKHPQDLTVLISHQHNFLYHFFTESNTKEIAFQSKIPVMSVHD
jgi:nucleotide-binding universal stress UspA family protein